MRRGIQSFIPFVLATLGYFVILLAGDMPLFEWKISKIVPDFPATYEVRVHSSPWIAYPGDSLDDGLYIFRNVWVESDRKVCSIRDFNFDVRRVDNHHPAEKVLNPSMKNLLRLEEWIQIEVLLALIYIWLFTIWHERQAGCFPALLFTGIAVFFYLNVSQIARALASPFRLIFASSDFGVLACSGKVTFNAELLKVQYETPIVLLVGSLLGLGGIVVMLREIIKAIIQRKESTSSTVG